MSWSLLEPWQYCTTLLAKCALFRDTIVCALINYCHCRTVEINNTDAEGRLVLGDGVSVKGVNSVS